MLPARCREQADAAHLGTKSALQTTARAQEGVPRGGSVFRPVGMISIIDGKDDADGAAPMRQNV
jgi:hypothetical protein